MATSVKENQGGLTLSSGLTSKTICTFFTNADGIYVDSIKFTANSDGLYPYLTSNGSGKTCYLYIKGSTAGSWEIRKDTIGTSASLSGTYNNTTATNTVFKGDINFTTALSAAVSGDAGWVRKVTITLTYHLYQTNCTAPSNVKVTRTRGVCTVSWTAGSKGANNPITNYSAIVNTSKTDSGATPLGGSPTTGTSISSSPGTNKTVYFGVRSNSAYNNTSYVWSDAVAIPAKPSVSAGTVITDTLMDNLRTWINTSGITDIADGATVAATAGNTYRSGLTAGTSKIEASWYNTASTG